MANIGTFMGLAEYEAARSHFQLDNTYRARLAKGIKQELAKGVHHDDLKAAIKELIARRLSPALLARKVEDIHKPKPWEQQPEATVNPYDDFPTY